MNNSKRAEDIDVIAFVNCLSYDGEMEKIDLTDAVYNMCQWVVDGVEFPEGMTPEQYMYWWNHSIDVANKYTDGIEADDSDDI